MGKISIFEKHFPLLAKKGKPLKAWYHGIPGEEPPKWLRRLKSQFDSTGLNIEFIGTDEQKMDENDKDIILYAYGTPITFVDPLQLFSFYTDDTVKPAHTTLSDVKYNQLFNSALKAETQEKRSKKIEELSKYIQQEFRTIPIAERRPIFAYSRRIKEVGRNELFFTFDYEKVKFKK